MKNHHHPSVLFLALFSLSLNLAGCGGGGDSSPAAPSTPTVTVSPLDNSTIATDTVVQFKFNTSMDTATLTTGGSMGAVAATSWSNTAVSNDTLTLSPVSTWSSTSHTLTMSIDSTAGLAIDPLDLSFTADSSLTVAWVNPAVGADINASQNITIGFSEAMDSTTLVISGTLASNSDGGTWSADARTLTLAPTTSWPEGTIALTLDVDNAGGTPINTLSISYVVDATAATATPTPANSGSLYDDTDIVIVFSETMDTATLDLTGSLATEVGSSTWSQTTVSNDTLTLAPASTWTAGAQTINVTAADPVGNSTVTNLSYTVVVAVDNDGDGYTNSTDCNDGAPSINPGATELCDGIDNNCSGSVDETCACVQGDTRSCYSGPVGTAGVGICLAGTQTCGAGIWGTCTGQITPAMENTMPLCTNSLDDDCDSLTDSADPDCPVCGAAAAACAVGGDCCSGVCLGSNVCQ